MAFDVERSEVIEIDAPRRAELPMEWSMRTSCIFVVSATLLLAAEPAALLSPAHADPAYTSQAVIKLFAKEKSAGRRRPP